MLTPLAVAALAMLVESPMHPYEMYQLMLHRREDGIVKLRPGSLYHTIARLERDGLAVAAGTDREGNRPERTTYAITDTGRAALAERVAGMLEEPADEYPEFPLGLSEASILTAEHTVELLATRAVHLRAQLTLLDLARTKVITKGVPEKFWIDIDYRRDLIQAQIDWIERLSNRITTGDLPW
ncbi:PadR family transcriptional regulator [Amnibacterium flavum]|uniref:Transcriptional regulator n=1 Tax=Amnibacterium flavum TaxID=2173173 RepID=A0A2V1HRY1_9MICO|nr:PadR family transcriptional regulator [Amnibacterium flavum]PVZ95355.1 transcriptional regulator [Amnibacterium flavum]